MSTKIEWVINPDGTKGETWNPITGCTKISEGCCLCYAERMARRLAGRFGYPEAPHHFDVTIRDDRFDQPFRWKKPRRIFVCSMGDLFHEDVPTWAIDILFLNMRTLPQHTFLVLTKRPGRMQELLSGSLLIPGKTCAEMYPNVLLGVTAENQRRADERIPILLQILAAGHFVSLEPMLSQIDLRPYLPGICPIHLCIHRGGRNCLLDQANKPYGPYLRHVILGGESGPGARPTHPQWVRDIRDQCQEASVPFLFKQHGEWLHRSQLSYVQEQQLFDGSLDCSHEYRWQRDGMKGIGNVSYRVGKKRAGRLLDGELWDEYPGAMHK